MPRARPAHRLLHAIARGLHENHDRLPAPAGAVHRARAPGASTSRRCSPRSTTLFALRADACSDDDDLLARHIDGSSARSATQLASVADRALDVLEVLDRRADARVQARVRSKNWPDVDIEAVRDATAAVDAARRRDPLTPAPRPCSRRSAHRVVEFVRDDRRGAPAQRDGSSSTTSSSSHATSCATTPTSAPRSPAATRGSCSTSSRTPTRSRSSSRCCSRPSRPEAPVPSPGAGVPVAPGRARRRRRPQAVDLPIPARRPRRVPRCPRPRSASPVRTSSRTSGRCPDVLDFVNHAVRPADARRRRPGSRPRTSTWTRTASRVGAPRRGRRVRRRRPRQGRRTSAGAKPTTSRRSCSRIKREGWPVVDTATGGRARRVLRRHRAPDPVAHGAARARGRARTGGHPGARREPVARLLDRPRSATCSRSSPRSTTRPTRSRSSLRCARPRSVAATPSSSSTFRSGGRWDYRQPGTRRTATPSTRSSPASRRCATTGSDAGGAA